MSFTAFSTALSGLNANSTAIDVVGNNLANLDTPGFKASTVDFHDLVTQSFGAGLGATQVGFGVGRPVTLREFAQGAIQTTNGPLDAAIQGDGLFVVQSTGGATEYTRGGHFQVAADGTLITSTGAKLQGWTQTNGALLTNGPVSNITVPVGTIKPPVPTSNFSFDLNLNAAAVAIPTPDTFSTSVEVFDSLGGSHVVTAKFTKNVTAGKWDYSITVPNADLKTPFTPIAGSVTFDANGQLATPLVTDPATQVKITGLADGASDLTLNWQVYNGTSARLTQFAQQSAIAAVAQDGSQASQLVKFGIADGGQIVAQYSNGQQTVVGQLALATIRNPESLVAAGNNNYQLSTNTSLPAIGVPATGGRGSVLGGSIESSTVDIATEFTNLIVFQRGYQANAKVITTVDQISQDTINLKPA